MNLSCDTSNEGIDCEEPVNVDHGDDGEARRYVVILRAGEKRAGYWAEKPKLLTQQII